MNLYLYLAIFSGIILGIFDIVKKKALQKNSLLFVLTAYSVFNFIIVFFDLNKALNTSRIYIMLIFVKATIVFGSWMCSFIAIKNLPISVISPFSTLGPVFSIMLGITILDERLSLIQALGLAFIFFSYYLVSRTAKYEVKNLFKNQYLYLMVIAMLLAAASAMIDKILLKHLGVGQMQFWSNMFTAGLFVFTYAFTIRKDKIVQKFNIFIPMMSTLLVCSDRLYFYALKMPNSQISIVSPLRKISIIISVILGGLLFREKNIIKKATSILVLIIGVGILFLGT